MILAVASVATVGAYLYYDRKPKVYTASTELFVQPSTLDQLLLGGSGYVTSSSTVENLALLVQTRAVAEQASRQFGRQGAPPGSITARPIEESSFIVITASAATPRAAAQLANAYATAFIDTQGRQLRGEARRTLRAAERQLRTLSDRPSNAVQREALEQKIQTLALLASQSSGSTGVRQVEPAVVPTAPTGHDPGSQALFAFVLGLMLAVGAAYGLEHLNRRITSVEGVEEVFELPVLAEIPRVEAPAPFDGSTVDMASELHEPFHRLQMNLDMLSRERPIRTILVASAAPGEGKSIVARNLAIAYREAGQNVAVLDADLRKGSLGGLLAAREGPGLADVLSGRASFGQVVQEIAVPGTANGNGASRRYVSARPVGASRARSGDGELVMVPAGAHSPNLSSALASSEMRETLRTAADTYGTAIIDSPPLLAVADVMPLLAEADAVLLVARIGVTTRDSAQRLLAQLARVSGIHIAGVVVNGIPPRTYRARAYGYYYG